MKNWSNKRRVSFAVHLFYVLVPSIAALVAAVSFWTWLFGSAWFSVPLIVSLEGVAAVGFYFRLRQIDSPFQTARHFIPFFSVATLGYELGDWLNALHGLELAIPFTLFIVGVFGTLFVKSFGVLEGLVIDPIQAAEEKATELARQIMVPVAAHKASARVYRQFANELREVERPTLTDEAAYVRCLAQESPEAAMRYLGCTEADMMPENVEDLHAAGHRDTLNRVKAEDDETERVSLPVDRLLNERYRRVKEDRRPLTKTEVAKLREQAEEVAQAVRRGQEFFQKYGGGTLEPITDEEATDLERKFQEMNVSEEEYTEAEINCKGCFGPCGRCHEKGVDPRDLVEPIEGDQHIGLHPNGTYGFWDEAQLEFYDGYATVQDAVEGLNTYNRKVLGNWNLDDLLTEAGYTREQARSLVGRRTARDSFGLLLAFGKVPANMTFEQFEPLFDELMEPVSAPAAETDKPEDEEELTDLVSPGPQARIKLTLSEEDSAAFVRALKNPPEPSPRLREAVERYQTAVDEGRLVSHEDGEPRFVGYCEDCGEGMTSGAKGVATKQASKFGGKLLCTSCRKAQKS